jgi:hypothetical protein
MKPQLSFAETEAEPTTAQRAAAAIAIAGCFNDMNISLSSELTK